MKLIKIANDIERYLDEDKVSQYRDIRSKWYDAKNRWVALLNKDVYNPNDYKWREKFEAVKAEKDDLKTQIDILKQPALLRMRQERRKDLSERDIEEKRVADLLERAKTDSLFQFQVENAVAQWPRTESSELAGYIMQDGDMLEFSLQGYSRDRDHREITQDIDQLDGGTLGMRQFQHATGAVRMQNQGNGYVSFDWVTDPTRSQQRRIVEISSGKKEIRILDKGNEIGFDECFEMQDHFGWY